MNRKPSQSASRIILSACLLTIAIITLSALSVRLWGGEPQKKKEPARLIITDAMTVLRFGEVNGLSKPILKKILTLRSKDDLHRQLNSFALPQQKLIQKVEEALVLQEEDSSKNWFKIPLKFALWLTILISSFLLLWKGTITPVIRKIIYLTSVLLFGVFLGADPSPMGPIKDAIALYGAKGVIFKPRLVALSIFLLTVILANKSICAWGCQFGTLQDLLFRLNRNKKDTSGVFRQYKPSFMVTNTIRTLFFSIFTTIAFAWGTDLIELIDPFKLFKPAMVTGIGWAFLTFVLASSLLIYRPWCHLFCPFGLVGWIAEHISIFKIRVNKETCIECGACTRACPSTVMGAIIDDHAIKPDCFACGTCINSCPTKSISLSLKS